MSCQTLVTKDGTIALRDQGRNQGAEQAHGYGEQSHTGNALDDPATMNVAVSRQK